MSTTKRKSSGGWATGKAKKSTKPVTPRVAPVAAPAPAPVPVETSAGKRKNGWTQLNVLIPADVKRRLRVYAAETETELSLVVTELLRKHLDMPA